VALGSRSEGCKKAISVVRVPALNRFEIGGVTTFRRIVRKRDLPTTKKFQKEEGKGGT